MQLFSSIGKQSFQLLSKKTEHNWKEFCRRRLKRQKTAASDIAVLCSLSYAEKMNGKNVSELQAELKQIQNKPNHDITHSWLEQLASNGVETLQQHKLHHDVY